MNGEWCSSHFAVHSSQFVVDASFRVVGWAVWGGGKSTPNSLRLFFFGGVLFGPAEAVPCYKAGGWLGFMVSHPKRKKRV